MKDSLITLTIDGHEVSVPDGTLIVDAAKLVGINIPVFCYHPKMIPVGMCRMCLVEGGRPARDRGTGEPILDEDGRPVINFGPNLETACTTPVGQGWVVRVSSEKAMQGRNQIVEYLLTSHPLDCPVCDKGGECPLQNLTMNHGPGKSRFLFDDKIHLKKHVPLGELIFLDRERCIQCARCIRFQEEIVDDPVLAFTERGRRLEIITSSDPGFDSYFSGNTTDICPVGALTTTDFRFGARPWELNAAASICPHCPVGCNLMLNTRREARSGGREVVKRVMPRQNEYVNEIWICDKGRFSHHYASSSDRLSKPRMRVDGELVETTWERALAGAADGLKSALEQGEGGLLGIAGGRASNEDLFALRHFIEALGGRAVLDENFAGGDLIQQVGASGGTNLRELGSEDAVLVIASDLHEEAPVWWLRLKQATEKGLKLIVANPRPTGLDKYATRVLRYPYGKSAHTALGLLHAINGLEDLASYAGDKELKAAAKTFAEAENAMIFYGGEGLDYSASEALAKACANLLLSTGHVGRANNGLIAVWPRNNSQGAWDMGLRPSPVGLPAALENAVAVYLMAADPVRDDPAVEALIQGDRFVIVQELFLTQTAKLADVILPAQSFIEREGTYTTGERRVQRFYPVIPPLGESRPDWQILAALAGRLNIDLNASTAAGVVHEIAKTVPDYSELTYHGLAEVHPQWPEVGGEDLYFGGTAYPNKQGLGMKLMPKVKPDEDFVIELSMPDELSHDGLLLVPVTTLYDKGTTVEHSTLLDPRLPALNLLMNPADADKAGVKDGSQVKLHLNSRAFELLARVHKEIPQGAALLPRNMGIPVQVPTPVRIEPLK